MKGLLAVLALLALVGVACATSATPTPNLQAIIAAIPTSTPTPRPTATPTPTPTVTPTALPTPTATPAPTPNIQATVTAAVQATLTAPPTPSPQPTYTPPPTYSPLPTHTPFPRPTSTPTPPPMTQTAQAKWTTYRNNEHGYVVNVAPGWTVDETDKNHIVIYGDGQVAFFQVASVANPGISLDQMADGYIQVIQSQPKALLELISRSQVTLPSGLAAASVTYRWQPATEYCIYRVAAVFVPVGSKVFALIQKVCEEAVELYQADLEAMQNNFVTLTPTPTPIPSPTSTPTLRPPPRPTPTPVPALVPVASACSPAIESSISGEFHGWDGETVFQLTNGQIWQQAEYSYDYTYDYWPRVTIFLAAGGCRMRVEGVRETISVMQVEAIQSRISGTFEGFKYERVYLLQNGQIWQQVSFDISIAIRLSPRVIIYQGITGGWRMQVEGVSRTIRVQRLR